jgi:hypothetical protein
MLFGVVSRQQAAMHSAGDPSESIAMTALNDLNNKFVR